VGERHAFESAPNRGATQHKSAEAGSRRCEAMARAYNETAEIQLVNLLEDEDAIDCSKDTNKSAGAKEDRGTGVGSDEQWALRSKQCCNTLASIHGLPQPMSRYCGCGERATSSSIPESGMDDDGGKTCHVNS